MFPVWFQQSIENLGSVIAEMNSESEYYDEIRNIFQVYNELSKDENFDQYIMDLLADDQIQSSQFMKSLFNIQKKVEKLKMKIEALDSLFQKVNINSKKIYEVTVKEKKSKQNIERKEIVNRLQVLAGQLVQNMQNVVQKKAMNVIKSEDQQTYSTMNNELKLTRKAVKRLICNVHDILQFYKNVELKFRVEIETDQELNEKTEKIVKKIDYFCSQGLIQHILEFVKIKQEIKLLNYGLYKINQKQQLKKLSQMQDVNQPCLSNRSFSSASSFNDDRFLNIQTKNFEDVYIKNQESPLTLKNINSLQQFNSAEQPKTSPTNTTVKRRQTTSQSLIQKARNISVENQEPYLKSQSTPRRQSILDFLQDVKLDSIKEKNETSMMSIGMAKEKGFKDVTRQHHISSCSNCNIM